MSMTKEQLLKYKQQFAYEIQNMALKMKKDLNEPKSRVMRDILLSGLTMKEWSEVCLDNQNFNIILKNISILLDECLEGVSVYACYSTQNEADRDVIVSSPYQVDRKLDKQMLDEETKERQQYSCSFGNTLDAWKEIVSIVNHYRNQIKNKSA